MLYVNRQTSKDDGVPSGLTRSPVGSPLRRLLAGVSALAVLLGAVLTGSEAFASAGTRDDLIVETFDELSAGPFAHGINGWAVDASPGNSVEIVEAPAAGGKSVRLTRASGQQGSQGTEISRRFTAPLTGTVTVTAKVMRSDGGGGGWFGVPYLFNEVGMPVVTVAFARGEILAYDGLTVKSVKPYVQGRWHVVKLVVDTVHQRFDLILDGASVLSQAGLRTGVAGVSRISWYANSLERGNVHVDDVTISRSEAERPDPGTTYYLSAAGDDSASGRSAGEAWRSLGKVNATIFQPGDSILLRSGDNWTGQLWPKGSGTQGQAIVIDRFGVGPKPRIAGNGTVKEAVRLHNQEYWEIRNLDVSNAAPAGDVPGANLDDLRGIGVLGDNGRTLHHLVIDSVDVHDVTGEIKWIGGDPGNNSPGVSWGTGWDRSKNSGGIIFLTAVADAVNPGNPTVLDGIAVQNSTIKNTSFANITVKQYTGDAPGAVRTGWGERRTAGDPRFTPHTNVTIRGNYLSQAGTGFGGNGVYLTNVRGALVERNVLKEVAVSGIETFAADQVTVQFNEIYGTRHAQGGADANGFDPDIATTNQLFQYNYLHDNTDGILLCACRGGTNFGSAVVRYNVVTGSKRWNLHMSQVSGSFAQVYHNTFASTEAPFMVSGAVSGQVELRNNVFASARPVSFLQSPTVAYGNNGYSLGLTVPVGDAAAMHADPGFLDPDVSGPYGDEHAGPLLETARAFALAPESDFVDAAAFVADRGDRDYLGTPVAAGGAADIGAFELGPPAPSEDGTPRLR